MRGGAENYMWQFAIVSALILMLLSPFARAIKEHFTFDEAFYQQLTARYGKRAERPVKAWQELIEDYQQRNIDDQLHGVNLFANRRVRHVTDIRHWGQHDYWATPIESLATGAGDCEDYAILKYTTLRALGVEEAQLRLMYVRATSVNEPHMVLIYFSGPNAMPLVLDNLTDRILPADKRTDLRPVYSFNGQGLWLSRAQGAGKKVKNSAGVSNWTQLLERIEQGE
ncbi:sulfate adenylyltransferase [Lacimicrobium alkaliphilum]|uniref:Sulfate adenylyltransferase n=2 Tax=Lacimicrobium alkaliphilum TaxID=1526571 RepID=A0ABQ1RR36_9ALTE|nr:sulfate adenylyltransferase [Lacimicrobium alkaliphilum]